MEPRRLAGVWPSAFFVLIGLFLWITYQNSEWLFYCPPPYMCMTAGPVAVSMVVVAVSLVAAFTGKHQFFLHIDRPRRVCLLAMVILTYPAAILIFASAGLIPPLDALDILFTLVIVAILTFAVLYALLTLLPVGSTRENKTK